MLCLTYTSCLLSNLIIVTLFKPCVDAACLLIRVLGKIVLIHPVFAKVPRICMRHLLALARLWLRSLSWRQKTLYALGLLIWISYQTCRSALQLFSDLHGLHWSHSPSTLIVSAATFLPFARPTISTIWQVFGFLSFRACTTLMNVADRSILVPFTNQTISKVHIWRMHIRLAQYLSEPLSRRLIQSVLCFACAFTLCHMHAKDPFGLEAVPHAAAVQHKVDEVEARLMLCTKANTPRFIPNLRRGKVVSVYDGDTMTLAAFLGSQEGPHLFSIRLAGVDAPEIRGASSAQEERAALKARDFLRNIVLNKLVTLTVEGIDKYGRVLAKVMLDDHGDVSQILIRGRYAIPYHGGKRAPWDEDKISGPDLPNLDVPAVSKWEDVPSVRALFSWFSPANRRDQ